MAASCHFLLYLEMGLFLFEGGGISTLAPGRFTTVVVMTARVHDQVGSCDLLSSLLPPFIWEMRKQLIKFVGTLLLGGEREWLHNNCFK